MDKSKYLDHIIKQYKYYKILADKAIEQINDDEFFFQQNSEVNSIAVIIKHISGNLLSRFHEFKTSDGEKPWRKRDEEFEIKNKSRTDLIEIWETAWQVLFNTLQELTEDDLSLHVNIRNQSNPIPSALTRSLSHCSYHIGQIIYQSKILKEASWENLSIPKGQSEDFNIKTKLDHTNDKHYTDSLIAKKKPN